ncbi:MAG: hypothetical protein ACRDMZ_09385, partial [Solirubrobacteraceae bacterium]
ASLVRGELRGVLCGDPGLSCLALGALSGCALGAAGGSRGLDRGALVLEPLVFDRAQLDQ